MQPRILLAFAAMSQCWLIFIMVSTRTFSAKLFPSVYWCLGLFLLSCGTVLPLAELQRFLSAHSYSLSSFLWTALQHYGESDNSPSQFCVISRLSDGTLCPIIQNIIEDVKQTWTQYCPLEYSSSYWPPNGFQATDHYTMALSFRQLSIYLLCLCTQPSTAFL